MMVIKNCVRWAYYGSKFLFFPLVLILTIAIPVYKDRPQLIVSLYTMFAFSFLANFVWYDAPAGVFLFFLTQAIGIGLALLFAIWGADFESEEGVRKTRMGVDRDTRIVLWIVPLVLLSLFAGRFGKMGQREFTFSIIIVIVFVCILARYYYVSLDTSTVLMTVFWLFGLVGFYAVSWIPALQVEILRRLVYFEILGILGYVFYDFVARNKQLKYGAMRVGASVSLTLYLVFFNIFGYRMPYAPADALLQGASILVTLSIAMSYWAFLAGRGLRWPWKRNGSA